MRRNVSRFFFALGVLLAGAAAHAEVCEDSHFQQLMHAAPTRFDARAVWLDARYLRWPSTGGGIYKLYHSAKGNIHADPNTKVRGADGALALDIATLDQVPPAALARFKYVAAGVTLAVKPTHVAHLQALHAGQLVLVQETADGIVRAATGVQAAGALDDLYASAAAIDDLGVTIHGKRTAFKLWAPTAQQVTLCVYNDASGRGAAVLPMRRAANGSWSGAAARDLSGRYYKYAVEVFVPNVGLVRNLVTDPYSISLSADSRRSYIGNLADAHLKPANWDSVRAPQTVKTMTDMVVYELHVRDFSINDSSVSPARRGKYSAFGEAGSNGMRHLAALAKAGLTDIHLLPVFDFGSVPERACATPLPAGAPDSEAQQALVAQTAENDCFNWGYDPVHYSAPEGSYSSDAQDGARRIIELRATVAALHQIGLRVGMDVVYNHTFVAGQAEKSVLDRIVPGYYHRLDATGKIERSTCCDNTATENLMMGKLMADSVLLWAKEYKIDSFRFDLMGHQPRAVIEALSKRVDGAVGRHVQLIGEGWNFGEVADGARFVQASQLSLNGSGIGTFSDRARDAVRGGSAGDSGDKLQSQQGFINGLAYDPNAHAGKRPHAELLAAADMVKVGLAGSLRGYRLVTHQGSVKALQAIDYNGQPAGYAIEPGEAVNYVENHDNQTLYDVNVFKLPLATSTAERARVQMLGAAINMFSQGVAYFHAGIDTLRSKSLDRNSFNSGDWFNRIDWSYQDNYFGSGAPRRDDNGADYGIIKPLLANPALKPTPADIAFARDVFRDLLKIRASTTLLRLRSAQDVAQRLRFLNTGPGQEATVIAAHIDGRGYPGAGFAGLAYFINVDKVAHSIVAEGEKGKHYRLHPAHQDGADARAAQAGYAPATGRFTIPPRTAVVFVE